MSQSSVDSLKIKAKLLQKAKRSKGEEIALKDAFEIIAKSANYSNWKTLKDSYEYADLVNPPKWSAQWKKWFSTKEEALKFQKENEFLMVYRKQFFICDSDYLKELGIDPTAEDICALGKDWTTEKVRDFIRNKLQKPS
ncbi:glyoxalase superfamily protein [Halobacteriovorax sp.]|uniref:glyoxalase superfamily protein n=1 Tax=Halobacteriovorax sp. TaxID=2020862 RepID=UPI0035657BB6